VAVTVHEALSDVAGGVKCPEHRDRTVRVHEQNGKTVTWRVGVLDDEKQLRDDDHYLRFLLNCGDF
jgi:hypothetical protein